MPAVHAKPAELIEPRRRFGRFAGVVAFCALLTFPICSRAQASRPAEAARPGEDAALERVLRERGLTELLERYLELSGDADPVSRRLKRREVLLAAYEDTSRTTDERLAYLKRATEELEKLLAEAPDNPEAPEWQLQLGVDLLFRQAEPYYNSILLRGGVDGDYAALRELAARAETIFSGLSRRMDELATRMDEMSEKEFARLERSGALTRLQHVLPRADYFLRWASFYRVLGSVGQWADGGLAHDEQEALRGIVDYLTSQVLSKDFRDDDVELHCRSLLLAGMCRRLLGDEQEAVDALGQCVSVGEALPRSKRPLEVSWSVSVAQLELIRALAGAGRYAAAHEAAGNLMEATRQAEPSNFPMLLSIALLDRQVYLRQLDRLGSGRGGEAAHLQELACRAILDLARQNPVFEDAVFDAVFDRLDPTTDPGRWDAVEQAAFLAGIVQRLAAQAGTSEGSGELALRAVRAEQAGRLLLGAKGPIAEELAPLTQFNLGLLYHLRGDELGAVRQFVGVVREHPEFARAELAANYAVKIAAGLYQNAATRSVAGVRDAFIEATRAMVDRFSQTESGRRWRFFLAGALEDARQYDEAATEYAQVDRDHERWHEACYRRVWCLWRAYLKAAGPAGGEGASGTLLPRRAFEVIETARRCVEELTQALSGTADEEKAKELTGWIGSAKLIDAEMRLRPEMEQYREALQIVDGFERTYADRPDLVVRALRIRLVAYQRLGEIDNALAVVSDYVAKDPANAGVFLQELLTSLRAEVEQLERRGLHREASERTQAALELARQLDTWADERADRLSPADRIAVRLQLADACLLAKRYEEALKLFQWCLDTDSEASGTGVSKNANALFGKAEALYQLGRYGEANTLFNELWHGLEQGSPMWWRSAARILACNTELGADARTLLRFVQQHRRVDPEFGGPDNRAEFEALEQRNRQRLQAG